MSSSQSTGSAAPHAASRKSKVLWFVVAVVFVGGVVLWNNAQMSGPAGGPPGPGAPQAGGAPNSEESPDHGSGPQGVADQQNGPETANGPDSRARSEPEETRASIGVVAVTPAEYQANLTAYGSASARYELTLRAQVSGVVERLSGSFEAGGLLKKGTLMASLENSDYQNAVASAEKSVADAEVTLLEAQREAENAEAEWKVSGLVGQPASPLRLYQPQLKAANMGLKDAKSSLVSAQKALQWTRIRAPFNALVIERLVTPGTYLSSGDDVATLYSTDRMEVTVALSEREWNMLPAFAELTSGTWPVTLASVESGDQWQGRVVRAERHADSETRQRSLVVAVDAPLSQSPAFFPGTFVEVTLAGKAIGNLWQLPPSALSQRGDIWYIGAEQRLSRFTADVVFSDATSIYVQVPTPLSGSQQVVAHPLSSYTEGTPVAPELAAEVAAHD